MRAKYWFAAWMSVAALTALMHVPAAAQVATRGVNGVTSKPMNAIRTEFGYGALGAHARAAGDNKGMGAVEDPGAAGSNFDDRPIGILPAPLTLRQTTGIGVDLLNAYPGLTAAAPRALNLARGIKYKVDAIDDKTPVGPDDGGTDERTMVAVAIANKGGLTAGASSLLTIEPGRFRDGSYNVAGTARAELSTTGVLGFAVAGLRDPMTFNQLSLSEPAIVDYTLGNVTDPFLLQVTDPFGFAHAFVDLTSSRDGNLLTFDVYLDYNVASLSDVQINVDDTAFSSASGFATPDDFATYLRSQLTFDPGTHTLTVADPLADGIPLYRLQINDDTPVTMSFGAGTAVGSTFDASAAAPEPGTISLTLLGFVPLARFARRRRMQTQTAKSPAP